MSLLWSRDNACRMFNLVKIKICKRQQISRILCNTLLRCIKKSKASRIAIIVVITYSFFKAIKAVNKLNELNNIKPLNIRPAHIYEFLIYRPKSNIAVAKILLRSIKFVWAFLNA